MYLRTNRAVLDAGRATAQVLFELNYTRIFAIEQPRSQDAIMVNQVRENIPWATITVESVSEAFRGSCSGSEGCTGELLRLWQRLRSLDARIIVHELSGEAESCRELLLPIVTDLLGEKTLYIHQGANCAQFAPLGWILHWMGNANRQ